MRTVGQPAGHGRGVAVPHRPAQHGQREPVDLEVDDPGDVGALDDALPARDPLRNLDRRHVIRAEEHVEHDAHSGDDERREESPAEVVDPEHPVGQVGGDQEDEGVRDQHEQEAEEKRERQPQGSENGRDDRVQRRDDHCDEQRAPEVVDVDTGQDPGGHHQRDARRKPRDEERERPPAGTLGLPGCGLAVRRLGIAGHQVLILLRRVCSLERPSHPRRDGDGNRRVPDNRRQPATWIASPGSYDPAAQSANTRLTPARARVIRPLAVPVTRSRALQSV